MSRDPLKGGLYVFLNRRRDRVKLLWWDGDGLAIWYKRLESGTFERPQVDATGARRRSGPSTWRCCWAGSNWQASDGEKDLNFQRNPLTLLRIMYV